MDQHVSSDVFNIADIGSSNAETYQEQAKAREILFGFLEKAIDFKKNPAVFLSKSAPVFKIQTLDSSDLYTGELHIYESVQNLGIQEKYIRGILDKNHWLTDLDIQRALKDYGLSDKVKISPFTEPSLRATIDLAVKDHADAREPYSIPLMLKRGSVDGNQGSHWLSLQVTIDPVGHKISYRIDDSLKLSQEEKQGYKVTTESALAAKVGEFHNPFPIGEGWTIDQDESQITGHASQIDGYSCGYRALRQLVSNPTIRGDNLNAKEYSELPLDSDALVTSLFRGQLKDVSVAVDIFDSLDAKGQEKFSDSFGSISKVRTVSLDKLQSFLTATDRVEKEVSKSHPKIEKVVGSFNQSASILRFPEGAKDDSLTAVEYDNFFTKLHDIENIGQSSLQRVDLPFVTSDALDGITSYFALNPSIAFKELGLFIDAEPSVNKEAFLSKLKLSISTLSKAGLEKIALRDEHAHLNEKNLEDLKEFAVHVGITCKIKLPAQFANSTLQRELDRVIERNQQKKNNLTLSAEQNVTSEKVSGVKSVRRREKLDVTHSKQVDVELQDSVEAEVGVTMSLEKAQEATEFVIKKAFSLDDLSDAVNGNDFAAFADLNLMMSKEDFVKSWHQIFGNIAQGPLTIGAKTYGKVGNQDVHNSPLISKISDDALKQLLKDGNLPAGGIDFQHLPQGFVLINDDKKRGGRILHYDANYKKQHAISPIIGEQPSVAPLIIDTTEAIITTLPADHVVSTVWQELNDSETYDSNKSLQFRSLLLDVLALPAVKQKIIIELCGGADNLDLDRMDAFFQNRAELASLYKDPFDASRILDASVVDKLLKLTGTGVDEIREAFISLAAQAETVPVAEHPLLKIITAEPDSKKKLQAAIDQFHLTPAVLNDLTRIYSSHGAGGINKILNVWQSISKLEHIKPELAAQIIANSNPLKDIINSPNLLTNCKRLNDFSSSKREWFMQLYANHSPKSDKDFLALLESFTEFSRQIENEYQLAFYPLADVEHPFTANIDMRTAMGRILSIMEACQRTDLGAQWDRISEIDLRSNAAIRAIKSTGDNNRRCYFVLPEMSVNPDDAGTSRKLYDTVPTADDIAPKTKKMEDDEEITVFNADDAETVQNRFFRYLSYQEHRMPLSFYTKAIEQIEAMGTLKTKIDRTEINTLYRLLAETTTGKNYEYFIDNPQAAEAQWDHVLERIKGSQLQLNALSYAVLCKAAGEDVNTKIYKEMISNLGQLNTVPSIEVMDKLVVLMTSGIDQYNKGKIALGDFRASMKALNQSNHMLRVFTDLYKDKVYIGMKFYDDGSYQKIYKTPEESKKVYGDSVNLFDHHTLVAWSINKIGKGFDQFAIPLISTFSFDHDNIQAISSLHASALAKGQLSTTLMEYFGSVFLDIETNEGLNAKSLELLMDELVKEKGFFEQVVQSFSESFEQFPELEERLRSGDLTADEQERYQSLRFVQQYLKHDLPFDDTIKSQVIKLAKPQIADFIALNPLLKAALPQGYADNLKSKKSTGTVALVIEQEFKTQELKANVEKIRVKFSNIPDEKLVKVIKAISTILSQCDTESEKLEVAAALANPKLLSDGPQAYEDLLSAIKKTGSSPFVYFMQQAQLYVAKTKEPLEGLCEKAAYFIGEAIPNLASRYENLNIVEFAPLIAAVINAGQQKELSSKVVVGDSYYQWQGVLNRLSAAKDNPEQLEIVLTDLDKEQANHIKDWDMLKVHLQALKAPIITRVSVGSKEEEVQALEKNKTDELTEYTFAERMVTVNKPAGMFKTFGIFFGLAKTETEEVKKFYKTTTTFKENKDPDALNADLVSQVISQVQKQETAAVGYAHALTESIAIIDKLVKAYPSAKSMLLPLTKSYLEHKGEPESTEEHIKHAYGNLKNLNKELVVLNDKDMVISLCEHFSAEGKYNFTDLIAIFNGTTLEVGAQTISFAGYPSLGDDAKKQLFSVVTSLLNNKKTCNLSDMAAFITALNDKTTGSQYLAATTHIYSKAPYPELNQFNEWWETSKHTGSLDTMVREYKEWSKKPVSREDGCLPNEEAVNGFNLKYAKEQYKKMSGIEYSDEELQDIKDKTEAVKNLTTDEVLHKIKEIRENPEIAAQHKKDPTELTALMAELLYRTKGMPQEGIGGNRKWGNSFEINTTQYLAVHSLLKSEKPTIAGIGTGEGKSRIMMISLAAQWALGRTVDFVTADVTLATRDYLEYQAYFKSIGAQTNLITAQTPVDQYCLDGINFSDASNLSLFRNKAHSQGLGDRVLNPKKEERCLLLDEADKTLFDTIDTRYNYSAQADQSIQDMPWVYENLVKFFKVPENEALFHGPNSDADECNRKFKEFAKANLTSAKDIRKLEGITRNQLESWQASAITALNLEYGKDFTLEANVPIVTKKGPSIVSQARLISGGSASKNAKFSFGVHQCLHARLNLESSQVVTHGPTKGNLLHEELNRPEFNDRRFPVDSENQIVYSSTSKAMVDDYYILRGVTGSPGAWTERAEKANIAFIDIPRHRDIKRIDRPYLLVKDNEMQFQQVIAEIRTSIANNQPSLLICKDDRESKQLFNYLTWVCGLLH